jgi:type I restriction enzyme S subunit
MRKAIDEIKQVAHGGVFDTITRDTFRIIEINLPPIPEQRAIAHILGTLDDKIELNRRMNEILEAMAWAIFKSWFVDFDPVIDNALRAGNPIPSSLAEKVARRRELRIRAKAEGCDVGPPKHIASLFPDRFVDSELGPIPAAWRVWRVSDVGNVICGKTPSTQVPEYYGADVPFITIPDMHNNVFAATTQKKLSCIGAASQAKKTLPAGAICVSCIATPGLVVITTKESQTNQQINSVVPSEADQTYYWFWIFRDLGDEIRAGGSGGSVLTNLSTGRFSEMRVLAATAELRLSYHSRTKPIFEKILANIREINTLTAVRDMLLPKLVSGAFRVNDAERFIEE